MANLDTITTNRTVTDEEINSKMLADPKNNKNVDSGEYNNLLNYKTLYGIVVTIFNKPKIKKTKKKRDSIFDFNF